MTEFVDDLDALITSGETAVVDFYANWCGPCKAMAPVFEQISLELGDKAAFVKVNIDTASNIPVKFQIRGVPTFLIVKDGVEVARTSGSKSYNDLKSWIEANLSK